MDHTDTSKKSSISWKDLHKGCQLLVWKFVLVLEIFNFDFMY